MRTAATSRTVPGHADLASICMDRQRRACWLYDFDNCRIIWANAAALGFWDAECIEELANRDLSAEMSEGVRHRLDQFRQDFEADPGRVFTESWTVYPHGEPHVVVIDFSWCPLPDGRRCTLIEARDSIAADALISRSLDALLHSQVMTALYDLEGTELYANRALRAALGPGPAPFGSCFTDQAAAARFHYGISRAGQHRETVSVGTIYGRRWYDTQAIRCRDAATGDPAFQVSATDVTRMRETEEELMAARDRAQLADQAKSEFVAGMSHEMRTPMNGILGMVEILSHSELTDVQKRQVEIIRDSGTALLDLIDDVLDLSSIELRAVQLDTIPIDLHELARRVVEGLMPPAQRKGLALRLEIADDVPRTARGDARRLAQLMRNMIGNAIKFTAEGRVALSLARSGSSGLLVQVSDTGPGVPEDQRKRIFERFHRASASKAGAKTGLGLGLSICREIVGLMGGEIGVAQASGGGASFWFTVPGAFVETRREASSG